MTPTDLTHVLHFSIGPVQSFVSQARRTRDFWAGSFLLSYLSATAMMTVERMHGEIVFPDVSKDQTMLWLRGTKSKDNIPKIGTAPNRFKAEVLEDFDPGLVCAAVTEEWLSIANAVRKADLPGLSPEQLAIWDRQIMHFLDMNWVMIPKAKEGEKDASDLLDRRKNWRTFMPEIECGDKCTVMGELQELSGSKGPNWDEQKLFWQPLKASKDNMKYDLREKETLCAVAFVKRRFVRYWEVCQESQGRSGWKLPHNVPSVSYMAAVHWLEEVTRHCDKGLIDTFYNIAGKLVELDETKADIKCIVDADASRTIDNKIGDGFIKLDGSVFFKTALKQRKSLLEQAKDWNGDEKKINEQEKKTVEAAIGALKNISDSAPKDSDKKFGSPSPFYAILLMDGDRLGSLLSEYDNKKISTALADFTGSVPGIVCEDNGFLVYAGGDDVLALMPLEDALPCANKLRLSYNAAFKEEFKENYDDKKMTISAAIIYAHMKLPLTAVMKDAHKLLEGTAKDYTGRDAVACRVLKPGGVTATWAMRWKEASNGNDLKMCELVEKFQRKDDPVYASKFLHRISPGLAMLNPDEDGGGNVLTPAQAKSLLAAEYLNSGLLKEMGDGKAKREYAEKNVGALLDQCRVLKDGVDTGKITVDGAMLLRFLAQKGVER